MYMFYSSYERATLEVITLVLDFKRKCTVITV